MRGRHFITLIGSAAISWPLRASRPDGDLEHGPAVWEGYVLGLTSLGPNRDGRADVDALGCRSVQKKTAKTVDTPCAMETSTFVIASAQ